MKTLGVYIHIPFCVRKCVYCDFLSFPAEREIQKRYIDALKREIEENAVRYRDYTVKTIFFGGGTPSILPENDIKYIINALKVYYNISPDAEVTLEANPKTAGYEKFLALIDAGVNRLSLGLQSADNDELKLLGRIHTYEDFLKSYEEARKAGFGNINIDLISAVPSQTVKSWENTLKKAAQLSPEHISAYSLIVEENTPLGDRSSDFPPLPDEEDERLMYHRTKSILEKEGYRRYEISNYAKKGFESRHNIIYWQRGAAHTHDYAGFGLGASSTVGASRWKNTNDINKYIMSDGRDDIKEEYETLPQDDLMEEFMFLGLRMTCGISTDEFFQTFGKKAEDVYKDVLYKWTKQGFMEQSGGYIRLTDQGLDFANMVFADFIL